MIDRLKERLISAREQKEKLDRLIAENGSFADELASRSLATHIDELVQQITLLQDKPTIEVVELRLRNEDYADGSVPLHVIARTSEEVRQMLGHAALRLTKGGVGRTRVPSGLFEALDLRLAALLPGSARIFFTSAAHRDLLDDGISKGALSRVFRVLESGGTGEEFLESVVDLGPRASRRLRDLLHVVVDSGSTLDFTWKFAGATEKEWRGSDDTLKAVVNALDVTKLDLTIEIVLEGVVELLSKRERIHLRGLDGRTYRVLFPRHLLPVVALLHLDQSVRLRCTVTEASNPLTEETSVHYELVEVLGLHEPQ